MARWTVASTAVTFGYVSPRAVERLEKAGCKVRLNPYGRPLSTQEMVEFAGKADAIVLGNDILSAKCIRKLKKLKLIARYGVDFDGVDLHEALMNNIQVTAAPASNREETADFTMGLILNLARHISVMSNNLKAGIWEKRAGISLYGKTIGIIGVGHVGSAVARRAMGFGLDVLGYDIDQRSEPTVYGLVYTTLNDLLRRSDIVTLHLPLNSSSKNLIGAKELRLLKPSAMLINTARSGVIREEALEKALMTKQLAAYATDVFDEEPPVAKDYFRYDNVLVTPHVAGSTIESADRMGDIVVDNILAAMDGLEPPDLVTPKNLFADSLGVHRPMAYLAPLDER